MNWITDICTPTVLLFFIVVVGYFIGRIKIYSISLDLSAILIVAVLSGYLLSIFQITIVNESFKNSMNLFSKLGTALFVSSIGLSTGISAKGAFKNNNVLSFLIGSIMVAIAYAVMKTIGYFDQSIDKSILIGILCGALTSTPGLSSACEIEGVSSELAILGYGCTYLFGVIGVVVFAQFITRKQNVKKAFESATNIRPISAISMQALIPLGISVILGTVIGNLNIPFCEFSLGTSGGILIIAILLGVLIQKFINKSSTIHSLLPAYRNLGLVMFFVGSGIPAGIKLNSPFEWKWVAYGVVLTSVPIALGYLASQIAKKTTIDRVSIVSGGMTSTPAIGVLLRDREVTPDLSAYSMSYTGALITMIILISSLSRGMVI